MQRAIISPLSLEKVIARERAQQRRLGRLRVLLRMILSLLPLASEGQVSPPAPADAQAVADTGAIVTGKFRLRYRIEGTGRPVIVIGDVIYNSRIFSQNLRKHLQLVFLDHRGFAPSPGHVDTTEFALDKLVDDVERARQKFGLSRIAVIGHSGHAFIALEYAKKYPANVSHVIMIGIGPDLSAASLEAAERYWQESVSPERKAALQENLRRLPNEELAKLTPAERFIRSYVRNGPRIWYAPRFDSSPLWVGVEINMEMVGYVWGKVFRSIDITQGLSTFNHPVFLALGRYDFIAAPPCSWDPIRPKFRNLTVRVFERSGHTPQYEEPELFDAELLRWIEEDQ